MLQQQAGREGLVVLEQVGQQLQLHVAFHCDLDEMKNDPEIHGDDNTASSCDHDNDNGRKMASAFFLKVKNDENYHEPEELQIPLEEQYCC